MTIDRTKMIVIGLLNIPPTFIPSRFSKWFLRTAAKPAQTAGSREEQSDAHKTRFLCQQPRVKRRRRLGQEEHATKLRARFAIYGHPS